MFWAYRWAAICFIVGMTAFGAAGAGPAREGWVTVTPRENDQILANPGMGWETFHETRKTDKNLPEWIPSTVHYARWGWGRLEPEAGRIDFAFLDGVLKESREAGQRLALRVMCCSPETGRPYHPRWLKAVGGREIECDYQGAGPLLIPDLDDPTVLARHLDFIARLGERYDGHADLDHVDVGSIGWWGEWHMSGTKRAVLPRVETREKVVDAYVRAFRHTRLLVTLDEQEPLRGAIGRGAGWRADCLGDFGMFAKDWSHMQDGYPGWIRALGVEKTWQTAPVAFEACGDVRTWMRRGGSLRQTFNYALALHASLFNNKSVPLPAGDEARAEIERFLRRLGYRIVPVRVSHPTAVRAGTSLELEAQWLNAGSAPCYRPYRVAYRLSRAGGPSGVFVTGLTVDQLMPGSVELFTPGFFKSVPDLPRGTAISVTEQLRIPRDTPAGVYRMSVAVVGSAAADPPAPAPIRWPI